MTAIVRSFRSSLTTHFADVPALSRMVDGMTDDEVVALAAHLLDFFVHRPKRS